MGTIWLTVPAETFNANDDDHQANYATVSVEGLSEGIKKASMVVRSLLRDGFSRPSVSFETSVYWFTTLPEVFTDVVEKFGYSLTLGVPDGASEIPDTIYPKVEVRLLGTDYDPEDSIVTVALKGASGINYDLGEYEAPLAGYGGSLLDVIELADKILQPSKPLFEED